MARTKSGVRLVLKGDLLQLRRAVAYTRITVRGYQATQSRLMLSVYVRCYASANNDDDWMWRLGARQIIPRNTPEQEQMLLLDALTYKTALAFNRDYHIVVDANPKLPREVDCGIQRPDA